jgi:hypothetical protein
MFHPPPLFVVLIILVLFFRSALSGVLPSTYDKLSCRCLGISLWYSSVSSFPLSSIVFLFCSVYCLLSILSSHCQLIGLDAHYGGPHLYFVLERHALFMCLFFCTPRFLICFTSQDNDFQLGIKFTYIIIFPPHFYCCYTRCGIHGVVRQGAHLSVCLVGD